MSIDANKAQIHTFYQQVWARGNVAFANDVFASNYVRHDLRPSAAAPGPQGQARIATDFRSAFPDLEFHLDLLLGEMDLVAARWTMRGTHAGRWGNSAPTGKRAEFCGVNVFRIAAGRVVEISNHRHDLGLMQRLGAPVYAGASQPG